MNLTIEQLEVVAVLERHGLTNAADAAFAAFASGREWKPTQRIGIKGFQRLLNTANCDAQAVRHGVGQ